MGIYNDARLFYGLEFDYEQVKHLKEKYDIEYLDDDTCLIISSPYFDADDQHKVYVLGIEIKDFLSLNDFIKKIDKEKTDLFIEKMCKEYNLLYEEPKILFIPDVI